MGKFLTALSKLADLISKVVYAIIPTPEERKRRRKIEVDETTERDRESKRPDNSFWKGR